MSQSVLYGFFVLSTRRRRRILIISLFILFSLVTSPLTRELDAEVEMESSRVEPV